jgi:hypothetical protein
MAARICVFFVHMGKEQAKPSVTHALHVFNFSAKFLFPVLFLQRIKGAKLFLIKGDIFCPLHGKGKAKDSTNKHKTKNTLVRIVHAQKKEQKPKAHACMKGKRKKKNTEHRSKHQILPKQ